MRDRDHYDNYSTFKVRFDQLYGLKGWPWTLTKMDVMLVKTRKKNCTHLKIRLLFAAYHNLLVSMVNNELCGTARAQGFLRIACVKKSGEEKRLEDADLTSRYTLRKPRKYILPVRIRCAVSN